MERYMVSFPTPGNQLGDLNQSKQHFWGWSKVSVYMARENNIRWGHVKVLLGGKGLNKRFENLHKSL